jgi:hypothetical protein
MIQRRASDAGIKIRIGNHTFRATGITAYLKNNGSWRSRSRSPITKAPGRPSFMTGGVMRFHSTRWRRFRSRLKSLPTQCEPRHALPGAWRLNIYSLSTRSLIALRASFLYSSLT